MAIELTKPWRELTTAGLAAVRGYLGVYEIGDDLGNVLYIGFAGGRSLFGLRGELERHLGDPAGRKTRFRVEVNTAYISRHRELLMAHAARHGALPELNRLEPVPPLGRLSPG
ncbi:MAG: hypothetical protein HY875_08890 [Chloroflexi bacterium]|nr:hypothetical protein [Chloroflexota bacterium]